MPVKINLTIEYENRGENTLLRNGEGIEGVEGDKSLGGRNPSADATMQKRKRDGRRLLASAIIYLS